MGIHEIASMEKLTKYLWTALLIVVFAAVYGSLFDSKLNIGGDNAVYIRLAENIADGHGYSQIAPDGSYAPSGHFPPGYSFILSLFMQAGIHSLLFFKVLNGLFLLTSVLILYYLVWKTTENRALAFTALLLSILSPQVINFASIAMSEMSYLFFTVLGFLFLFLYAKEEDTSRFWRFPVFWLSIVSLMICYHIRTIGMSALFALLLFFAFRKEWKQLAAAIGGIILLAIPWGLRNTAVGIESRYFGTIMTVNPWRPEEGSISSVGEMIEKMLRNFDDCVIKGFKEILFPFLQVDYAQASSFWAVIGGLIILGLILYGAWNLGKLRWLMLGYLVANIGLFMLWHGGNGNRYVIPITPMLFACFYTGIYYALKQLIFKQSTKFARQMPYAFLILGLPMLSPLQTYAHMAHMPYTPAYQNYFAIAREANKQAPRNTVICARKPELFMHEAPKLISVNYKYSLVPEEVIQDLIDKRVEYVVLDQLGYSSTPRYLYPAIERYIELFPVVWHLSDPDTYLLRFNREKALKLFTEAESQPTDDASLDSATNQHAATSTPGTKDGGTSATPAGKH